MSQHKNKTWDPVFDLNRDMLEIIYSELNISDPVAEFKQKVEKAGNGEWDGIAEDVFGRFGVNWIKRTLEIGDDEKYMDRGYEVLRNHCKRPEIGPFPFIVQRFMEVSYLSLNPLISEVGLLESSKANITFWIDDKECNMFNELKKDGDPDIVAMMPCKHMCLSALNHLLEATQVTDAEVKMDSYAITDKFCRFSIIRKNIQLPTEPILHW